MFTKKVKGSYQSEALSQLPKRVFIINSLTFEDNVPLYTTALYNNMDEAQSNNVTTLINSVTIDIDMSKYIPDLIENPVLIMEERKSRRIINFCLITEMLQAQILRK